MMEFKPVTLSNTIVSKEELRELWHRLNAAVCATQLGYSYKYLEPYPKLWNTVNSIMQDRNIKPHGE